ncbi:MAG: glycosyltransferase [Candidatus Omnitrophota bacterium]
MKILIIYATAGAGHKKAAEALYNRLLKENRHEVVFADALDYTTPFFRQSYSRVYTFLITRIPWLWGFFFELLNQPWMSLVMEGMNRLNQAVNARSLDQYLREQQFDYIFSTHFFPSDVAGYLKRIGKIKSIVITVITDFDVHRIWLARGVDRYAVASDWTREKTRLLGIPKDKTIVTGIPTDEKFSSHRDNSLLKKKLGLNENLFTVLIATGSFGIGPIEQIVDKLTGMQVLVVCGHNRRLAERLAKKAESHAALKVYGFVNNMDELMSVADAMITKPGGLSIAEALVTSLPLIFFNAIPGQEENNVKVLAVYRVGVSGPVSGIVSVLRGFQDSPEEYRSARLRAQQLGKPNAAADILSLIK